MAGKGQMITGAYDYWFVGLSVLIAVMASYAALDLAGRVTSAKGRARVWWLGGGAVAMGTGVWSMHYIGMLAFRLPVPVLYDWPTVGISLLAAIFASAVALFLASRQRMGLTRTLFGGVFMGGGISSMHYIGMQAMRLPAMCHYSWPIVVLSAALAMVISVIALRLTFHFRGTTFWSWKKGASALLMGAAIPSMHYTGMAAAHFTASSQAEGDFSHALTITALGTTGVIVVTFMVLALALLTSIADRRFSAQAMRLEASENRFRAVFEGAPIGISISGLADGKIAVVNPAYQKLLGCSQEEMQSGQIFDLLTHPDDRQAHQQAFQQLLKGEDSVVHLEKRYILRSGQQVDASVVLSVVRDDWGQPQFILRMASDVTERNRAKLALEKAKDAAEAASEAKSTFLATMSHEIRTPMNGIVGMTELVLDSPLTEEQRENLVLVRSSAESLLTIINDILDFSKIESGKLSLESIAFALRHCVGETMKSLSVRAQQKGLELIYEVEPEVPDALLGDPGRLRQILTNLVGNAIKFTEHGEIFVHVAEESQESTGTLLYIFVKDTGIGIPEDKQAKVFEAFAQADGSTSRKYGGTGLGLSICVRLIHMMEGRIWVNSHVGQGSTFHFTARFAVQELPVVPVIQVSPEQLVGQAVLIVDDNRTNQRVLSGMVANLGMKPALASGGLDALRVLQLAKNDGQPFRLILLDANMPEMDGFALTETLRKDPSLDGVKIIMLTSAGRLGDAARCVQLGISGYLLKPIHQSELLESICGVFHPAPLAPVCLVTRHTLQEARSRLHILLAEDNAVNQRLAVRMLEKRGYVVSVAGNGREAIAAVEKKDFDLILMDVQMPEMDGFEATTEIRKSQLAEGKHVPIVAMTAHALKGDEDRCLAAGMDAYVSKPFRPHELFATIEKVVSEFRGKACGRSETVQADS